MERDLVLLRRDVSCSPLHSLFTCYLRPLAVLQERTRLTSAQSHGLSEVAHHWDLRRVCRLCRSVRLVLPRHPTSTAPDTGHRDIPLVALYPPSEPTLNA